MRTNGVGHLMPAFPGRFRNSGDAARCGFDFDPAPCPGPTGARAGSAEKVEVLRQRVRVGVELWHPLDGPDCPENLAHCEICLDTPAAVIGSSFEQAIDLTGKDHNMGTGLVLLRTTNPDLAASMEANPQACALADAIGPQAWGDGKFLAILLQYAPQIVAFILAILNGIPKPAPTPAPGPTV